MVVDTVSLARDTLHRTTGDCDDLTVLFCTILEAAGKETAFNFLVGQVMKATKGKANPKLVTEILKKILQVG